MQPPIAPFSFAIGAQCRLGAEAPGEPAQRVVTQGDENVRRRFEHLLFDGGATIRWGKVRRNSRPIVRGQVKGSGQPVVCTGKCDGLAWILPARRKQIAQPTCGSIRPKRGQEPSIQGSARRAVESVISGNEPASLLRERNAADDRVRPVAAPEDLGLGRDSERRDKCPPVVADPSGMDGAGVYAQYEDLFVAAVFLYKGSIGIPNGNDPNTDSACT
jgi:hypothetical protein